MTEPIPANSPAKASPPSSLNQLKIDRSVVPSGKKSGRGKWLAIIVAIVVATGVALRPGKTEVQATSVLTAYPSQQYAQLTASGYVVAQRRAAVASKATGRLVWLNVREGSQVKQGEVIAKLDASDVQASIASAQASIRQAEAGVAQSNVELINAEAELKRSQGLKAQGFVSAQALDSATTRVNSAKAAVISAQAAVAVARAQLKVQQVNQDFTEIRAPFDGVVLVKNANVGDIITPFSSAAGSQGAVVTMADMSTLEVEADVSESNLAKAKIGQPVEITLDALPDSRFRGNVVGIVPTVDRAKATVMTKIRFEKLDPRILPEMSAKVTILSQAATDADQKPVLALNPKAIVERAGKKEVFRIKDDTVEAIEVSVGRKIGDNVEIKAALQSGDKLVLSPGEKLVAGTKIVVASK
ncbi:efflux RND transporter periplasmic adaptor subunit [Undibacterium sp. Jales W-56]|uniref:efflux RND transporter periplasmic adaptor subunit n=1 Tax=Undibacterium sp. Jales W-56 TaxID=2897325 RepID=UPI0021CFEC29|nr:efflux RND transporter periplasmic adaptor subunit [Undibacterium sp. Jales W-56]MCU6433827.1 efflux RND transporter periplasmic adaptor subunit [Undibacterium sp. Jales W-56]